MKSSEIISPDEAKQIQDEECLVCELHKRAYEKLKDGIHCPHCNASLTKDNEVIIFPDEKYTVVGEVNFYSENQDIRKLYVQQCDHCSEYFAITTEKIIYNANHDIYYTGGRSYLSDHKKDFKIKEKIRPLIEDFYNRVKEGENLKPWNLEIWLEYEIEHIIANYLFENGYKR
jgi:hypothetical protein